jgi:hypothetical protein
VVSHEKTETFAWEEEFKIGFWGVPLHYPFDHISEIDALPALAPEHRTIDPTYDDYGNVIAQTATTEGGVRSEFTLVPAPPDTTAWLVDLPKDYKFRSWTPYLHTAPPYRHVRFQHDAMERLTMQWVEPTSTDSDVKQAILYVRDPAYGSYEQVTGIVRWAPGGEEEENERVAGVDWHDSTGEQIFPSRTWNGLSHTTTRIHHPAYGVVLAEASPDGVETFYHYDDLGRLRRTLPEGGDAVELTYREKNQNTAMRRDPSTLAGLLARRAT